MILDHKKQFRAWSEIKEKELKLISVATIDYKYMSQIHNIYSRYYPNNKMQDYNSIHTCDYMQDLNYLYNIPRNYGYQQFDLHEYEMMCKTEKYSNYFPIFYCDEDSLTYKFVKYKNSKIISNQVIVAIDFTKSSCETFYDSTFLHFVYLSEK